MELAKRLCWHELEVYDRPEPTVVLHECKHCGVIGYKDYQTDNFFKQITNPRFTIAPVEGFVSLVEVLQELGLWEEFVKWLSRNQHNTHVELEDSSPEKTYLRLLDNDTYDILTNTDLFMTALCSFLEGRNA
jgi:hypothetical protein